MGLGGFAGRWTERRLRPAVSAGRGWKLIWRRPWEKCRESQKTQRFDKRAQQLLR
jgi:hypothetical protein